MEVTYSHYCICLVCIEFPTDTQNPVVNREMNHLVHTIKCMIFNISVAIIYYGYRASFAQNKIRLYIKE